MKIEERKIVAVLAVAAVAVVVILLGGALSGDDSGDVASAAPAPSTAASAPAPAESAPASAPEPPAADPAPAPPVPKNPTRPVSSLHSPPANGPAFAAIKVKPGAGVPILTAPRGDFVTTLGDKTDFGSARVLSVAKQRGPWLGVIAPELGNAKIGWVRHDPAKMERFWTKYSLRVDLSGRSLELRYGDSTVGTFPVTIGGIGSETPEGRFAITDGIRFDASPYYGCCAMATSGHQPNLPPNWIGGDRIALHGTAGPVGGAESHGCLRATDETMEFLMSRVPLGTPLFVTA